MASNPNEELSKIYDPASCESRWYNHWRDSGYFGTWKEATGPTFSIVLPPPNVTGRLHMGHALTASIEDTVVRWHRMMGDDVVWLPGTDHAGIATQIMVERDLEKEGLTRLGIGRDEFLKRVWKWKEEHSGHIDKQHELLGASLDWDRYRFTMDDVSSKAVREAFCRLHEQGLIYRAYRLINWDHGSNTALSDLEVEHREVNGSMWHIAYAVEGSDEKLIVATTRPETMLGDTGVAVHPEDERYKHLIGKNIELPLVGRKIPIVADDVLVDMEFGTGAVKLTPAHDFNDFESGKRHNLDLIQVVGFDGNMNDKCPERFQGLSVKDARKAVVDALEECGALIKVEDHKLNVGFSQRTGVVVEPLPSHQWYVKTGPMAEKALDAVKTGETKIYPESRAQDYYRWMENIHDWCISRQLWWGHRIPAWQCSDCDKHTVDREDPTACSHCGGANLTQDEDVLDTWFSSGLWPLTTLGWPEKTVDFDRYYPTQLLETGWDILFFWVARMMMFGIEFAEKPPFETIYLHSMVLGTDGQKMSKTKGNVVDPAGLVETYGADALRYYLCTMASQELGIVFSQPRVEGYRNFCTKLWNASRFGLSNLSDYDADRFAKQIEEDGFDSLGMADRWILSRALETALEVNESLKGWKIDRAAHAAYQFVWYEFCDWYLELAKQTLRDEDRPEARFATQGTLATVLDIVMRVLHPMIPFITEEIWSKLPKPSSCGVTLMREPYPRALSFVEGDASMVETMAGPVVNAGVFLNDPKTKEARSDIDGLIALVRGVRMMANESKVPSGKKVEVLVSSSTSGAAQTKDQLERIKASALFVGRFASIDWIDNAADASKQALQTVIEGGTELLIPLRGLIDFDEERARIDKDLAKAEKELLGLTKKLENENFMKRAPAEVVEKSRAHKAELEQKIEAQRQMRARLED